METFWEAEIEKFWGLKLSNHHSSNPKGLRKVSVTAAEVCVNARLSNKSKDNVSVKYKMMKIVREISSVGPPSPPYFTIDCPQSLRLLGVSHAALLLLIRKAVAAFGMFSLFFAILLLNPLSTTNCPLSLLAEFSLWFFVFCALFFEESVRSDKK